MKNNHSVLITGASSGIGEALAYAYAGKNSTIGLVARRGDILDKVAEKCRAAGSEVYTYPVDITDESEVIHAVQNFYQETGKIDLVIANAGVGGRDNLKRGDLTDTNRILSTNILGVSNAVIPCLPNMIKQNKGHIVIVSSIAGFRGMVDHGAYSASKAAVRILADGWRFELSKYQIHVTTICPGFIDTPLVNKNRFPMPFLMDAETAALKIRSAIAKNKRCYVFPWQWRLLLPLIRIIPDRLIQWVNSTFNS